MNVRLKPKDLKDSRVGVTLKAENFINKVENQETVLNFIQRVISK